VIPDPRLAEPCWRPYVEDIALACLSREPYEDAALVVAIGIRESNLGRSLSPRGDHNGTGDGGHGRGLFQIDDRGPFKHLIPEPGVDWPPFIQVQAACQVLATARHELVEFKDSLSQGAWEEAVVCRYNSALSAVQWALRNGKSPNDVTTGKDYGRDVLAMRDGLRRLYPATFPPILEDGGNVA
jgi:hypothetical protein